MWIGSFLFYYEKTVRKKHATWFSFVKFYLSFQKDSWYLDPFCKNTGLTGSLPSVTILCLCMYLIRSSE